MTKQDYFKLLDKYELGLASQEEMRLLYAYYNLFDLRKDGLQGLSELQIARLGSDIKESISQKIIAETVGGEVKRFRLWPRIVAVSMAWKIAAAVAAITLGTWLYYGQPVLNLFQYHPDAGQDPGLAYTTDITPGKNTATLTLANGETISLSDAKMGVVIDATKLTYNDGTAILSSLREGTTKQSQQDRQDEIAASRNAPRNDVEVRTLAVATPRGGTYQVLLPDGSKVWLNAASSIKFPSSFEGAKQRGVELVGEAYFEVFKNKNQKFVVTTKNQQVEVLGTHFNINAYSDEGATKTTLLAGSVQVSASLGTKRSSDQVILRPNQQSVLTGSNPIKVHEVDTETVTDWKDGDFNLDKVNFKIAMRKIARWYDVEVIYDASVPDDMQAGGWISRASNLSSVLKLIEASGLVRFKVEGRKIYVYK